MTVTLKSRRQVRKYAGQTEIVGDLVVERKTTLELCARTITRDLWLMNEAEVVAPNLKRIAGEFGINAGCSVSMPELEEIDGYLTVSFSKVTLNALKRIGRNLFMSRDSELTSDSLNTVVGLLYIDPKALLNAPKLLSRRVATQLNLTMPPM